MTERSHARLVVLGVLVTALLATLLARAWQVQVVSGPVERATQDAGRIRAVALPAPRGRVLDARGRALVANRSAVTITADRTVLAGLPDAGRGVLGRLAGLLGLPWTALRDRLTQCGQPGAAPAPACSNGSPYAPVALARDVPARVALHVVEHAEAFPGVTADAVAVRVLPRPWGVAPPHLVGHLSAPTPQDLAADPSLDRTDVVGRDGLERSYDADLRGRAGQRRVVVDGAGRVVDVLGGRAPVPGHDLLTSIDARVQAVVERQLAAAIHQARRTVDPVTRRRFAASSGAALVMDVRSGRLLAMASAPTYDARTWLGGITTSELAALEGSEALLDRVTQSQGPAASPFKVVTAAAAVRGGASLRRSYPCPAALRIGDRSFANNESRAHGDISIARALEVSCDTVFYRFGYDLWRDGRDDLLAATARSFGLGAPTGVDLPGEASGRVADRAWKRAYWAAQRSTTCAAARRARGHGYAARLARETCTDGWRWRAGDVVNASIGQGDTLVTPLQVATAYAAIANGGTRWEPRVARAVLGTDGGVLREVAPRRAGRVGAAARVLAYERAALRETTRTGTGAAPFAGFPLDRFPIATKTGTAEVVGAQATSWFVSFDQHLVVLMTVAQGGTGSGTSGPSVRRVWEALYGVRGTAVDPADALLPGGRLPALPVGRSPAS